MKIRELQEILDNFDPELEIEVIRCEDMGERKFRYSLDGFAHDKRNEIFLIEIDN